MKRPRLFFVIGLFAVLLCLCSCSSHGSETATDGVGQTASSPLSTLQPPSPVDYPQPAALSLVELFTPPPTPITPTVTPHIVIVGTPPPTQPWPTPIPTPVVTRVSPSQPPFLDGLAPSPETSQTIYFRAGNVVSRMDTVTRSAEPLLDVGEKTSLSLGKREDGIWQWGSISPDGNVLALVLTDAAQLAQARQPNDLRPPEPHSYIYLYNIATGEMTPLVMEGEDPVWSPDGTQLAFLNTVTRGLETVDVASGERQSIFAIEPESGHLVKWVAWSPDGKQIAFVKAYSGSVSNGSVWVANANDGANARELVEMEMYAFGPKWSSTGDQLLFFSTQGEHATPQPVGNIWMLDVGTGTRRQLTRNLELSFYTWSPDGKWIAFSATNVLEGEDYQYDLWLLSEDGSALKRLTDDPATDQAPHWGSDGTHLIFYRWEQGVWKLDLQSGSLEQIDPQVNGYWLLD